MKDLYLIVHNVRSVHNVGSLFRTADAAGVSKIFLVGITPTPVDRFNRARKDFAKTSLGAEKTMPWESVTSFATLVKKLKKGGIQVVGLECGEGATPFQLFKPTFPTALVVGNEVEGVSKKDLKLCDAVIEIPMKGMKESLNVGVAAGIALFRIALS